MTGGAGADPERERRPEPERDPELPPEPEPGLLLATGVVLYGAMAVAALVWLWWRDRLDALPQQAIGRHGPLLASGVGLVAGVVAAAATAWATPRIERLRDVMSTAQRLFAKTGEGVGIAFVLIAAIAEELFFRLAVQDAFGLFGSVAAYTLLHMTVGGMRWLYLPVLHALLLGGIVQSGFGLLGSTTAHAILNHLSLRRIQSQ